MCRLKSRSSKSYPFERATAREADTFAARGRVESDPGERRRRFPQSREPDRTSGRFESVFLSDLRSEKNRCASVLLMMATGRDVAKSWAPNSLPRVKGALSVRK